MHHKCESNLVTEETEWPLDLECNNKSFIFLPKENTKNMHKEHISFQLSTN